MKNITRDEAKQIVAGAEHFSEEIVRALRFAYGEGAESDVELVSGPLKQYEVFDVTLSKGDLAIDGLLDDAPNDFSLLIVLGDLRAADCVLQGEVFVVGDMTVTGALVCGSSGDHRLYVGGNLTVDELVVIDHNIKVLGTTKSEQFYERGMHEHQLAEACFDDEGEADFYALSDLVREGYSLFD